MIYTLITPIRNVLGKTQTELNVRDHMTVGDVLAARKLAGEDTYQWTCAMLKRIAGLDQSELDQLDVRDFTQLDLYLAEIQTDPKELAARKAAREAQAQS